MRQRAAHNGHAASGSNLILRAAPRSAQRDVIASVSAKLRKIELACFDADRLSFRDTSTAGREDGGQMIMILRWRQIPLEGVLILSNQLGRGLEGGEFLKHFPEVEISGTPSSIRHVYLCFKCPCLLGGFYLL